MSSLRKVWRVCSIAAGLALSGCAGLESAKGWQNRYGPDPAMPADTVTKVTNNHALTMASFLAASQNPAKPPDWSLATQAGLNFVDDQCDAYLHELYAIDQERNRLKKGLDGAGLLTNAVLAAVPASKTTMAIVTQSFGLTSQFVDTAADSYLYGVHVTTIFSVVDKLQTEYRKQVGTMQITSEPQAYNVVRGYLRLCMPPVIQGKIDEALTAGKAKATTDKKAAPAVSLTAAE